MNQAEVDQTQSLNTVRDASLRKQLQGRRQRLHAAVPAVQNPQQLMDLLQQIDAALARMDAGTFGICETCHEPIENDRMLANPLCRNCLDHLSPDEQRALERDLDLAFQVQRGLLPEAALTIDGWSVAYHYEPAGPVSGDYCDLIALEGGAGLFLLGDVTGKGVAASMLMAHLHAIFRSLATVTRALTELVASANRIFCQGTLSSYFATLVCGRINNDGEVEICNAGHCPPLHLGRGVVARIGPGGLPLGVTGDGEYRSQKLKFARGDGLVLYSDGLSESFNHTREQYGVQRLADLLKQQSALPPKDLLAVVLDDLKNFRSRTEKTDDLTIMIIRREC